MCIACEWAPHFSSLSTKATRRTALRAVAAAAFGAGAVAACSTATDSSSTAGSANSDSVEADFVFRNGRVYTVAGKREWAKAVAVKGNTITHVGDEAGAMAMVGPSTQIGRAHV